MSVNFGIEGPGHPGSPIRQVHVHQRGVHSGLLTFTQDFLLRESSSRPFISATLGTDMAQNVAFTGEPTIIHAGTNSGALKTGTTDGSSTTDHLIDSGGAFTSSPIIVVGMSVKNTTSNNEYALITAVTATDLTLDTDIFLTAENYEINPIWVGTAVNGTWNFADSSKITITTADDGDRANFENDTDQNWNHNNNGFTVLTGTVDLDIYSSTNNTIEIRFDLNGTQVGDTLLLDDFIDTGNFASQSFAIPIADFNLTTNLFNGMSLTITRVGGSKPTIKFDAIQWEEIGASEEFRVTPAASEIYEIFQLVFSFGENGLDTLLSTNSVPELDYTKLMGITALTNGIIFRRVEKNETRFSVTLRQISDFLATGGMVQNFFSLGTTNTFLTISIDFPFPLVLNGSTKDFLSITINDNLSDLELFTTFVRGYIVTEGITS